MCAVPHSNVVLADNGNVAELVTEAARRAPDHPALIFRDEPVGWADLDGRAHAMARGLLALGLTTGDRVALAMPNSPDWVAAYLGALRAGMVALPVNPAYAGPELVHLLGDSGARVLIGTDTVLAAVAHTEACTDSDLPPLPALAHRFAVGSAELAGLPVPDGKPVPATGAGDDLAVLLYTSGTSGRPKGAMLSHRALLANLDQLDALDPAPLGDEDVMLLTLPLFHAFGLGPGLHAVARHAATAVLVERFDPAETLAMIGRHGVTCVLGVPAMFGGWARMPSFAGLGAGVRLAVSGAAPLPAELGRMLRGSGVPMAEGYGLTEAAPVVTSTLASPAGKPGSIGRPLPGVTVRLVGADGTVLTPEESEDDEHASPGTDPGELWIRGANLFSGYWPDGAGGPNADGWWPTADLAYADPDGDLFLVDRLNELILVSGFNVYPREVELVLAAHPAVAEAAVIGVPHPHTGHAVKAFVVPAPGTTPDLDELRAHCARNLARFKCPETIELVEHLPHSATGKVRKSMLSAADVPPADPAPAQP